MGRTSGGCAKTWLLCLSSVDFGVLEEAVDLAVAVAVEAVAGVLAGGRFEWGDAGEAGECCFVAAAGWV